MIEQETVSIRQALLDKEVPKHRFSFWYYLGGLALLAFVVQAVTGALLVYYFQPGPTTSLSSLEMIVRRVPFGWLVRSIHAWSASFAILLTFAHFFAAFFAAAYRGTGGRSLWWTGTPMLAVVLAFGYTGSWLPHVQGTALREFYMLHVVLLPLISAVIVAMHVFLSLLRPSKSAGASVRYYPTFLLGEVIVWLIALLIVILVAWFLPWEFNGGAFAPGDALRLNLPSQWYLLWQRGWLDALSGWVYWLAAIVILLGILVVPSLGQRGNSRAKLIRIFGIVLLAALPLLSALAYFSSPG